MLIKLCLAKSNYFIQKKQEEFSKGQIFYAKSRINFNDLK
jgi:hypothetical protein